MLTSEALEILSRLPPNTPFNSEQPFSDKRFTKMWCPFHNGRYVWLQVYRPYDGYIVLSCSEACRSERSIWAALRARHMQRGYDPFYFQIVVSRITTTRAAHRSKSGLASYSEDTRVGIRQRSE